MKTFSGNKKVMVGVAIAVMAYVGLGIPHAFSQSKDDFWEDDKQVSIPLGFEPKEDQLKRAVNTCSLPILNSIFSDVFGEKPQATPVFHTATLNKRYPYNNFNYDKVDMSVGVQMNNTNDHRMHNCYIYINDHTNDRNYAKPNQIALRVTVSNQLSNGDRCKSLPNSPSNTTLYSKELFPFIAWNVELSDETYDSLGNLVSVIRSPRNIRIIIPKQLSKSVALINESNHRDTGIRINSVQYTQCLWKQLTGRDLPVSMIKQFLVDNNDRALQDEIEKINRELSSLTSKKSELEQKLFQTKEKTKDSSSKASSGGASGTGGGREGAIPR